MTCITDRCRSASDCAQHVTLLLQATAEGERAQAEDRIAALAQELRAVRSGSARNELVAAGSLLRSRFTVDASGRPATLRPAQALVTGAGHPLVLGAVAVSAARRAGLSLGLLAGPRGRLAIAHTLLPKPLVLDLGDDFALCNIDGDEPSFRWLCADAAAQRVSELAAPAGARVTGPAGARQAAALPG